MKENNVAQAAQNAIEWATKPGAVENFPATARAHINGLASLLLSKLRAPVADERAAQRNEGFSSLSLWWTMIEAEAELAGEPIKDDAPILSFMGSGASHQVTAGDIRAALASAPVAGEQIIAWDVQDTGLGRRYTTYNPKIAEDLMNLGENVRPLVYASALPPANAAPQATTVAGEARPVACLRRQIDGSDWGHWKPGSVEDGQRVTGLRSWQVRWLVDAAPQASAEAVRNAALEEAAAVAKRISDKYAFGHYGNETDTADEIEREIMALKQPQADKDGGQQRAGDDKEPQ